MAAHRWMKLSYQQSRIDLYVRIGESAPIGNTIAQ